MDTNIESNTHANYHTDEEQFDQNLVDLVVRWGFDSPGWVFLLKIHPEGRLQKIESGIKLELNENKACFELSCRKLWFNAFSFWKLETQLKSSQKLPRPCTYSSALHTTLSLCAVQKLDGANFRPPQKLLLLIAVAAQVWDVFVYTVQCWQCLCRISFSFNFGFSFARVLRWDWKLWISLYHPSKTFYHPFY